MKHPSVTPFNPHYNNANEVIDAKHLNELQEAVNQTEHNLKEVYNRNYTQSCLIELNHDETSNALKIFTSQNQYLMDQELSSGVIIDEAGDLTIDENRLTGVYVSQPIRSHLANSQICRFKIDKDDYDYKNIIKYSILTENQQTVVADNKTPHIIETPQNSVRLQIEFTKRCTSITPVVHAFSLRYEDLSLTKELDPMK